MVHKHGESALVEETSTVLTLSFFVLVLENADIGWFFLNEWRLVAVAAEHRPFDTVVRAFFHALSFLFVVDYLHHSFRFNLASLLLLLGDNNRWWPWPLHQILASLFRVF